MYYLILRADTGVSMMQLLQGSIEDAVAKWAQQDDAPPTAVLPCPEGFAFDERWRDAYRHDGQTASVSIPAARQLRKAELLWLRDKAYEKVRRRIETAEDNGDSSQLAVLRYKRNQLRQLNITLDAQLEQINDLATLDTWKPDILTDADTQ